jgi:O-antigen ligase
MAVESNLIFTMPLVRRHDDVGIRFLRLAVFTLLPISILAPVVRLNSDFWLKLDQLLIPVVMGIYLFLMLAGMARTIQFNPMFLVAAAFIVCTGCSLIYGSQVIGHPLLTSDLFELVKPVFPWFFFTLAYEADFSDDALRKLNRIMLASGIPICLYAYAQWFNMGFTAFLQPYYSGGLHDEGGLAHYRRVYSTLSNPNFLGMLMTWLIAAFTLGAVFRVGSRAWNVAMLVATLVTLTMTGSRYGLIDTGLVLLLILIMPTSTEEGAKRRRRVLVAALPITLFAVLVISLSNKSTADRFEQLGSPLQENSLRMRLDGLWQDAFSQFLASPLLGQGPAKIIFSRVYTDSEYLQILKEYGLVGLLPYVCLYLVPLGMVWKGLRVVWEHEPWIENHLPAMYWALCVALIIIVTALFMNVGMSTYFNFSLAPFLWMWMGLAAGCARSLAGILAHQPPATHSPCVTKVFRHSGSV